MGNPLGDRLGVSKSEALRPRHSMPIRRMTAPTFFSPVEGENSLPRCLVSVIPPLEFFEENRLNASATRNESREGQC
jgi:hypothetical protein